ncbi:hypothetical protein CCB80_13095 [Armatimonadetes bacterium Uphvl-Ar1]|nr:hypothetical protein CCB80_13095 [Armatimonadetes bacterium Uphvl-Ar1]
MHWLETSATRVDLLGDAWSAGFLCWLQPHPTLPKLGEGIGTKVGILGRAPNDDDLVPPAFWIWDWVPACAGKTKREF